MKKLVSVSSVFSAAVIGAGLLFLSAGNVDAQDSEGSITLYGNDFIDEIPPRFTEDTGIEVNAVHHAGGELFAQVEAEQANPQWDVLFVDGHGSMQSLADRDFLLTDWEPENLSNLDDYFLDLVPEDYAYFPTGLHAAAVIAYNTDLVDEADAPQNWEEFFAFEGQVGHADPAVAAPAYPLVSALFEYFGVEEAKEMYLDRMDMGLSVYPKNGPVTQALLNGEIEVAALQEHNAYGAYLDGEPVEIIWPEEGAPGSLRIVAINAESENLEEAKAFVEYLLENETQQFMASLENTDSFFTPSVADIEGREEREEDPTFLLPAASWAAEFEAEIKTWFADQNVN
ncbi:MAG TPA: extracellular solute-binding protein [Aliicoccus persicus]|uniref:Extracellular solute-binding protein n=1 Tax=Aliicoccus persicus TaxID=930138 RepID=A0A921B690_9STAP|nr:extracellular solute-binding protein [Aliicoccus persicus]